MSEKNNALERLTPQRKLLVEHVLKNLEEGTGIWKKGWRVSGVPESATTGKKYRGVNNFYLTLIAMTNGYTDNRWATYNQIEEKGWSFKTDEEGKSLAKGKGATIEFFELRDRETKKPFDKFVLEGMSEDEKQEYIQRNIYPLRKYYRVFNADLIDGIPQKEIEEIDEFKKSDRTESFIQFWSDEEAEIKYGGVEAYYSPKTDKIQLPKRNDFKTVEDFYSTALHEIGHSTGHSSRLNRDLTGGFGTEEYAQEELRAEIASMFLEQEFGVAVDESDVRNNSAYLKSWAEKIKEDPDALFKAITDADKIAKYVVQKEKEKKEIEQYAIVSTQNSDGQTIYKVYMKDTQGQTVLALGSSYESIEDLMEAFNKLQEEPAWRGKEFQQVSFEELDNGSSQDNVDSNEIVAQEPSEKYFRPSEIVAKNLHFENIDMTERGIESLTHMSDRELVEKAKNVKTGAMFSRLYNGENVFSSDKENEKILMMRIGMFCNGDAEQALRIFKSSGQYRSSKPDSYYLQLASNSMKLIDEKVNVGAPKTTTQQTPKTHVGFNTKT